MSEPDELAEVIADTYDRQGESQYPETAGIAAAAIRAKWRLVPVTFPGCEHERRPGTWGHNGECIACAMSARGNVVINTGNIGPYEPA